jgi:hypothetical protein
MRTLAPKACGGKLDLNFDFTTPLLPCGRVTRLQDNKRRHDAWRPIRPYPQITRTFDPAICRLARYTYATRCANTIIQHVGSRGMIHKNRHLSEVELCVLLCRNALYLKKGSVGAGVTFTALMAKHAPFAVESVGERRVRFSCSLRDLVRWVEHGGQRDVILIQVSPSTTSQANPTHIHRAIDNNRLKTRHTV